MKKWNQNGFSAVEGLLILITIGLIGGVSWYVWQSKNNRVQQNQASSNTPQAKVIDNSGIIPKGWREYKDPKYKFSFSYPEDWKITTNTFADDKQYIANADDPKEAEGDGGYTLRVFIGTTLTAEVKAYEDGVQETSFDEEKITKGSYEGIKLTSTYEQKEPKGTFRNSVYYFQIGNDVYQWSPVYEQDTLNPDFITESNNFLDSLKLL
ncbi:MAG: hypothetical protein M3Q36_01460 [bacterium]|nr:hypothetical protein [bacterium]